MTPAPSTTKGCDVPFRSIAPFLLIMFGSILLAAFFHVNLMNPIFPDAQPYDTYLLAAVALAVVWFHPHTMFRKEGSCTEVIPATDDDRSASGKMG